MGSKVHQEDTRQRLLLPFDNDLKKKAYCDSDLGGCRIT